MKKSVDQINTDTDVCPYVDDMHEQCNIGELNSMTIEFMTNYCGRGNYKSCNVYKNMDSNAKGGK